MMIMTVAHKEGDDIMGIVYVCVLFMLLYINVALSGVGLECTYLIQAMSIYSTLCSMTSHTANKACQPSVSVPL